MALTRLAMVVMCGLLVEGCSPFGGGAFQCATSDQCGAGTCEPEGFCSFPDATCASGRRFGELGGSLAGVCVGELPGDGSIPLDDAMIDSSTDAPIDMTLAAPFCDAANDSTLVGCWEFEQNTNDASGDGNNATSNNISYALGKVGQAVVLQSSSSLVVGERASLEPPNLTVEAWVRPSQTPPSSGRWAVMDNDGAYGVFVTSSTLVCVLGGTLTVDHALAVNVWTHVACTTDGTTVRMYIDGLPDNTTVNGQPLSTGNGNGVVLAGNSPSGDRFVGSIDQMRVFNTARTQVQICEATGLATCK
ncbi:MAG: LamG domain-containing protein [Kofleriaceae bacterium]